VAPLGGHPLRSAQEYEPGAEPKHRSDENPNSQLTNFCDHVFFLSCFGGGPTLQNLSLQALKGEPLLRGAFRHLLVRFLQKKANPTQAAGTMKTAAPVR
jgi:hypothetical protein